MDVGERGAPDCRRVHAARRGIGGGEYELLTQPAGASWGVDVAGVVRDAPSGGGCGAAIQGQAPAMVRRTHRAADLGRTACHRRIRRGEPPRPVPPTPNKVAL